MLARIQSLSGWPALSALILMACLILSSPAAAQSLPTPQDIANLAQQNPAQAAQQMAQQNGAININDAMSIAQRIASGGLNLQTAGQLIAGMINNQISSAIGKALSNIPNLGNINPAQLASSGIGAILSSLGNDSQAVNSALNILGLAGGGNIQQQIQQMIQNGAATALTNLIAQAFPELAQKLGLEGLQGLLTGLIGGGGIIIIGLPTNPSPGGASCNCEADIRKHHETIKKHMENKRKEHEIWLVTEFFTKHVAKGLMLMAEQLTVVGMQQVQIIGSFFDAKHQLETQRLMQQLTAEAHKDYQPSEGICTFGTSVRSLAASERAAELAQEVIAARGMQRQLRNGEGLTGSQEVESQRRSINQDRASRTKTFIERFCDKTDNNKTLDEFCKSTQAPPEMRNRDIDYTRSVENKLTLDVDFYSNGNENPSNDEAALFALAANLYGHEVIPYIDRNILREFANGRSMTGETLLMDARALNAKRSVAQNSFAAITSMRAAGTPEAQPYLYKMVAELGVPETDLEKLLGKNPSYFAQMEILTKKALQNPVFYTELYDKPVNVDRKGAVLQAIGLMQDRDIYNSLLRAEAVLSVLLETMLQKEHRAVEERIRTMNASASGNVPTNTRGTQ